MLRVGLERLFVIECLDLFSYYSTPCDRKAKEIKVPLNLRGVKVPAGLSAPHWLAICWNKGGLVILEVVVAQAFGTNCWIFAPSKNSECFIVDPGITAPSIVGAVSEVLRRHGLKPIATLITHGHLDHTFSVLPFSKEYGVPTYIQSRDRRLLRNPYLALDQGGESAAIMARLGITIFEEPEDLREFEGGERFSLAGFEIETIHAPGHTQGSAMFIVDNEYLISGDVLFNNGIGRTDLPTGSAAMMAETLITKVLTLDDGLNVLPGHGSVTTIGRERKLSPYLQESRLESMKKGGGRG